jgi:hypothetical protein
MRIFGSYEGHPQMSSIIDNALSGNLKRQLAGTHRWALLDAPSGWSSIFLRWLIHGQTSFIHSVHR